MHKHTILILSLVLLIAISTYSGVWCINNTVEGVTTMETPSSPQPDPVVASTTTLPVVTIDGTPSDQPIDKPRIDTKTKYNSDNLDVEYHDDLQTNGANNIYDTTMGTAKVYDVNGNLVDVVSNAVQGNIVYYQPGSYKYGATSYVPYYEDSVFLSRSTNAIVNTPTYITTNVGGGFCNKYRTDSIQLEHKCNAINNETCAATNCCVLLGGQKCVSGSESGPTMKDNYSDFMIANKDFYYYQGKCYGNCPNTPQFPFPALPEKLPYMPAAPGPFPGSVPPIPTGTPMPPLITNIPPPPPSPK
jgi:hypothetical protein